MSFTTALRPLSPDATAFASTLPTTDTTPQQLATLSLSAPTAQTSAAIQEQHRCAAAIVNEDLIMQTIRAKVLPNPFFISRDKASEICRLTGINTEELLTRLIPIAKEFARPLIFKYQVGVAGLGKSGNIYLGVNLEFLGTQLPYTVHGEQFLIVNARNHDETELTAIAISAAPCGYCRQFLNEIGKSATFKILIQPVSNLQTLLPHSFGPQDLGITGGLLTPDQVKEESDGSIDTEAKLAASRSYAPYTNCPSGVAIKCKGGTIYSGSYLENAAFNPTLSPIQTAVVALVCANRRYDEINEVLLAQKPDATVCHISMTNEILRSIAPNAVAKPGLVAL